MCYAFPTRIQTAFRTYSTLLPAFIHAMVSNTKQDVRTPCYPISVDNNHVFPYILPNIAVGFNGQPPSDVESVLSGAGAKKENIKGSAVYLVRSPSSDLVTALLKVPGINKTCPAPDQFVNLSSLNYIGLVRRIFAGFFLVNHYPAFRDDEHIDDIVKGRFSVSIAGQKRKAAEPIGSSQGVPGHRGGDGSDENIMEDIEEHDRQVSEAQLESDKIQWAYPSGTYNKLGWGTVEDLGVTDGLWFPFVPELQSYDHRMVPNVILKHFMGCLGHSTDAIRTMYDGLRGAWGVVKSTDVGKVFGHMAKCIELGLEAQARVFPIFSGEVYEGCVLCGAGFTVVVEGRRFSSKKSSELSSILATANRSLEALKGIAALAKMTIDDIAPESGKIPPMMTIKRKMASVEINEKSRDEILKLCANLRLPPYRALNPSSLITAFDLCRHGSWETLPDDLPIHPSMLFEKDVISVVWSSFGPMAPSPRFSTAPQRSLSARDFPKHIGFTSRLLSEAIADIKEIVRTKSVTIPSLNRRSAIHKDRIFDGRSGTNIIAAIRQFADVAAVDTSREDSTMTIVGEGPDLLEGF